MRIGLAQINTIIGDFEGNSSRILDAYQKLIAQGADLVIFPELCLSSYPPRDLLFRNNFSQECERYLEYIAKTITHVPAVIGYVATNKNSQGKECYNAVAWCEKGKIEAIGYKCLLPNYDVFEDSRYFEPSKKPLMISFQDYKIGVLICEDNWNIPPMPESRMYTFNPLEYFKKEGVDCILNLSASPWDSTKESVRQYVLQQTVAFCRCPMIYCNAIGANDELIFDGQSIVMDASGKTLKKLPAFEECLDVVELELSFSSSSKNSLPLISLPQLILQEASVSHLAKALVCGIRDYARKTGFTQAILGLSGGIDSAVVAVLAAQALGPENVIGVSLPSQYSSDHSKIDAEQLAQNLNIPFHTVPIHSVVNSAEEALHPLFHQLPQDITEENLQARTRGLLLMALSNKFKALLLNTGNKSELAMGYCTLYGDMNGAIAVLGDVLKHNVYALAHYFNSTSNKPLIPRSTLEKPPSAELRPNQVDEDTLPPYKILDSILQLYLEKNFYPDQIITMGYDANTVHAIVCAIRLSEYKRKQCPPVLKVTPKAFGIGRKIPIVQKFIG